MELRLFFMHFELPIMCEGQLVGAQEYIENLMLRSLFKNSLEVITLGHLAGRPEDLMEAPHAPRNPLKFKGNPKEF